MPAPINLSRFDLTSLRLLVATVEGGSLTRGAERLNMSLAAASKRMAEFESQLGTSLLERSKRGVVPTAAGQTLLRYAIEIVAELEQLSVTMADFHGSAEGHLRLWANSSAFAGFLPHLLAEYSAAFPAVMLDLQDALSEETVRAVARGGAELGVVGGNTSTGALEASVCDVDELVLILPHHHRLAASRSVALEAVVRYDFVGLNRATSLMRHITAATDGIGRALKLRMEVRGLHEVCRMVAVGLGLAIVPHKSVSDSLKIMNLRAVRLTGMATERKLLLVTRDRASLSAPARGFLQLIDKKMATRKQPRSARAQPAGGAA